MPIIKQILIIEDSYRDTTRMEPINPIKNNAANPIIRSNRIADIARDLAPVVGSVFIILYPSPPIDVGRKLLKKKPIHKIF